MDNTGRFLLAIVLMIAVMVVTNIIFPPVPPTPVTPAVERPPDTLAPDRADAPPPPPPAPTLPPGLDVPPPEDAAPPVEVVPADTIVVSSPLYRYAFSTRGAALIAAQLLRYESHAIEGEVVDLAGATESFLRHRVTIAGRVVDLTGRTFRAEPATGLMLPADSEPQTLRMIHDDPAGEFTIELDFTFEPGDYLMQVRGRMIGLAGVTPQLLVDFGPTLPIHEANPAEDQRALSYVVNVERAGIHSVRLSAVRGERIENGPLLWFALKNKYFVAAALIGGEGAMPFGGLIAREAPGEHAADLTATLLPRPDGEFSYRFYAGPQEADRLVAIGHNLHDVNPYGWRVFRPILRPISHGITWLLVRMHTTLDIGYGWVLILFGVLIRIAMWPLNAKAMRSQLRNMEIQPRLKEIQAKYKNEPEKLQKEMLRLYKEEGFNPMGGCLPLLIPFPLLIALFFVFQSTIEFRGVEFLWLPDLARADPLYILPVLLGGSMFLLQWISMRTATEVPPQMKFMMYFMPVFMVIIFLNLASGLNLYYASMNFASLPQQLQIMRERKRHQARKAAGKKEE